MGVTVILECQAKSGTGDELKATFNSILPDTRAYDGCQGVEVVCNQDDNDNIVLLERWESRPHYEKYLGWRDETGALKALGDGLAQPPSIRYYDAVDA